MINVKVFTFNPVQENTYIIYNENRNAIIIDPGCYFKNEQAVLRAFIQENKLKPIQLLNTHCHLDHVFGNYWVHETYQLALYIHANEKPVLEYAPISGLQWGLSFKNYDASLHYLKEGDTIYLDNDELEVLFTPGHSPGSISFYCKKQHFAIVGDVLFFESIGRTDLPGGNHETLLQSIREKLFVLPEETIIYNGHGASTTIGHEIKYNPFLL
ncbi:MAG: MBL fold metallo-hydrolase [Chitinophagaceae bacterium]|nr:MBL fold metallo-hydrolase [Chitinophagaceae bacterium]MCW5906020.1 MBL fold metallo-hydrolase [Chitinophagaceae bacterium]